MKKENLLKVGKKCLIWLASLAMTIQFIQPMETKAADNYEDLPAWFAAHTPRLGDDKITIGKGETELIQIYGFCTECYSTEGIKYSSSNKSIVMVDSNGKMKGVRPGKATIKITVNQDNEKYNLKLTVTVNNSKRTRELKINKDIAVGNVIVSKIRTDTYYNTEQQYGYTIKISNNKGTRKTITNALGLVFIIGSNMYYTEGIGVESDFNRICKMNVKTLKTTVITKRDDIRLSAIKLPYIYYNTASNDDWYNMYKSGTTHCMNINTKKTVKLLNTESEILVGSKRVCVSPRGSELDNFNMYSYNFNGTGKIYIGKGLLSTNIGNYIYYVQFKYDSSSNRYFRVVRTNLKGKNRKILTKYTKNVVSNYDYINVDLLNFIKETIK